LRRPSVSVAILLERTLHPTQVIVLSFAGAILLGAALLSTPWAAQGDRLSFIDALFTSTSATCVTGLVVVDTGSRLSLLGQGLVLGLIELGGLGIMTFSSVFLVLVGRRLSFRGQVVLQDTLGRQDRLRSENLVRDVVVFTLVAQAVGTILLTICFSGRFPLGTALYQAVFHSVSAFCNAGFSLFPTSLVEYRGDWLCNGTILSLVVLGGLGFLVMEDLRSVWAARRSGRRLRLQLHTKVVLTTTVSLIAIGAAGFWAFEAGNTLRGLPWQEKVLGSLFQAVTPRTAGFNTLDYGTMTNSTLYFTILLMFVGASPGSAGGGIKTTTFAVVLALFLSRLEARAHVSIFRRTLPDVTVSRAMSIMMGSFALVTLFCFALLTLETGHAPYGKAPRQFIEVMFESVSAFATVGLSTGMTPGLSDPGKLLVTALMFIGRVGPLTLAMAVAKKAESGRFHYAEENVTVG
jgi:trk system potassium uptake protein